MDFDNGRERGYDRERGARGFNRGSRDESKNQGGQG